MENAKDRVKIMVDPLHVTWKKIKLKNEKIIIFKSENKIANK